MNNIDKIARDSKILVDYTKDNITNRLVTISSNLGLSENQLKEVINLINVSAEESYQKAIPSFQNSIKKYF